MNETIFVAAALVRFLGYPYFKGRPVGRYSRPQRVGYSYSG